MGDAVSQRSDAVGATGELPLLGRARELADLDATLEDTAAGRGGLVLLTGEPGIGKTRLATALGERASTEGHRVAWARGWDGGGAPAFWPWVQVVRSLAGDRDDKGRIYAAAGILSYWIINLVDRQVEVYTSPSGPAAQPGYSQRAVYRAGDYVPLVLDGTTIAQIAVQDLLP